tara:strand:+ start:140 stop:370 length:231 start_codon:yes stop_codon:yes gene_type:complete
MNNIDYTKIERPVEPAFANEDPEGWVEVLAWEEARADKLEQENVDLREALKGLINCRGILTSDKDCVIKAKQLLNK